MASSGGVVMLTARDIMTTKLVTLKAEMPVHDAIALLLKNRVSGAPVVDDAQHLVGVLSEKDCISEFIGALHERLPTSTIEHAMSTEIMTVHEDTDLLTIAHIFTNNSFRRLPVIRDGLLVGQISRRDLLNAIDQILKKNREDGAMPLYLSAIKDREDVSFS